MNRLSAIIFGWDHKIEPAFTHTSHSPSPKRQSTQPWLNRGCVLCTKSLLVHAETLFEPVDTPARINQLLTAGEERMAFRTNFNTDVFLCRTCMDHLAAGACDRRIHILGMDALFHLFHLFLVSALDTINVTFKCYHSASQITRLFLNIFVFENCNINCERKARRKARPPHALRGHTACSGSQTVPPLRLSLIHISEPTRQAEISYAVFCLKKKKQPGLFIHYNALPSNILNTYS